MRKNIVIALLIWLLLSCTFSDMVRDGIRGFIAKALFVCSEVEEGESSKKTVEIEAESPAIITRDSDRSAFLSLMRQAPNIALFCPISIV